MKRIALWLLFSLLGWGTISAAKAQAVLSGCTREALKGITDKYFAARRGKGGVMTSASMKGALHGALSDPH